MIEKRKRIVKRVDSLDDCLTYQQMLFVREFVIDFNALQAAIRAGYTEKSATRAHELLKHQGIRDAIAKQLAERTNRLQITADMVVEEYAKVAFANITDIAEWDENGQLTYKASADIPQAVLSAIAEVNIVPTEFGNAVKIKLHSKMDALNSLAKHLGMFTSLHKHEHSGPGGEPIQYQELPTEKLAGIAQHLLTLKKEEEAAKN